MAIIRLYSYLARTGIPIRIVLAQWYVVIKCAGFLNVEQLEAHDSCSADVGDEGAFPHLRLPLFVRVYLNFTALVTGCNQEYDGPLPLPLALLIFPTIIHSNLIFKSNLSSQSTLCALKCGSFTIALSTSYADSVIKTLILSAHGTEVCVRVSFL